MKQTTLAPRTWVILANGRLARIFSLRLDGEDMDSVLVIERPDASLPERELGSDRPGRTKDRFGYAHHAMEPHMDLKRHAKQRFAANVAQVINQIVLSEVFDNLIVIAPPQVLGDLRKEFSHMASSKIIAEIDKDWLQLEKKKITDRITESLSSIISRPQTLDAQYPYIRGH